QAEDGIRDLIVTGVQTCALPICRRREPQGRVAPAAGALPGGPPPERRPSEPPQRVRAVRGALRGCADAGGGARPGAAPRRRAPEIGRASCRGRVEGGGGAGFTKK